jgi:hypothetical protein
VLQKKESKKTGSRYAANTWDMIRIYARNAGKAKWLSFSGWTQCVVHRKSPGIRKSQTENSIKNQTVQNMDLAEYCINLSKSLTWLYKQARIAIQRHVSADKNPMKGSGKPPTPLY